MNTKQPTASHLGSRACTAAVLVALALVVLLAVLLLTGRGQGLRRLVSSRFHPAISLVRAVQDSQYVASYRHGDFTDVIFLHHSVGYNLIEQGGVREKLAATGYDFWDHDYNYPGLLGPDNQVRGYDYNIPDDNTDPDGLARIFSQQPYGLPLNAFSGLLQHEVIVFKSCFPVSNITSEHHLSKYKSYYLSMRNVMDQHQDRIFIVVTPPPLNPAETTAEATTGPEPSPIG